MTEKTARNYGKIARFSLLIMMKESEGEERIENISRRGKIEAQGQDLGVYFVSLSCDVIRSRGCNLG